ncbi:MAG: hypothetical protein H6641_02800 [Caldilineaceae bacterium]|nr:hypothetical protein [Caldilineaceae bacterium]
MDLLCRRNSHFAYCVLHLFFAIGLVTACAPANQGPSQIESIGQIASAAASARQGVLLVRQYVADDNSWEYREASRLYGEAQAAFNGWIEQLKADIIFGVEPNDEKYDAALADAIQKAEDFLKHVHQIEQVNASIGTGSKDVENNSSERDDVSATLILGLATQIIKDVEQQYEFINSDDLSNSLSELSASNQYVSLIVPSNRYIGDTWLVIYAELQTHGKQKNIITPVVSNDVIDTILGETLRPLILFNI